MEKIAFSHRTGIMRIIFYIAGFFIVVFGVSFSMLNPEKVSIHYYIGTIAIPLPLLLAVTLGVGILLGGMGMFFSWIRLKRANIALKHQLK